MAEIGRELTPELYNRLINMLTTLFGMRNSPLDIRELNDSQEKMIRYIIGSPVFISIDDLIQIFQADENNFLDMIEENDFKIGMNLLQGEKFELVAKIFEFLDDRPTNGCLERAYTELMVDGVVTQLEKDNFTLIQHILQGEIPITEEIEQRLFGVCETQDVDNVRSAVTAWRNTAISVEIVDEDVVISHNHAIKEYKRVRSKNKDYRTKQTKGAQIDVGNQLTQHTTDILRDSLIAYIEEAESQRGSLSIGEIAMAAKVLKEVQTVERISQGLATTPKTNIDEFRVVTANPDETIERKLERLPEATKRALADIMEQLHKDSSK